MRRQKLFPVTLSCKHEILLMDAPRLGAVVACYECSRGSKVVFVRKYTGDCRDCTYRNHEGDLTLASGRARQHCEKRGHRVRMWYPTLDVPITLIPDREFAAFRNIDTRWRASSCSTPPTEQLGEQDESTSNP